jgi:hypothetical protein
VLVCILEGFPVAGKSLYILTRRVIVVSLLFLLSGNNGIGFDKLFVFVLLFFSGNFVHVNEFSRFWLGFLVLGCLIDVEGF